MTKERDGEGGRRVGRGGATDRHSQPPTHNPVFTKKRSVEQKRETHTHAHTDVTRSH